MSELNHIRIFADDSPQQRCFAVSQRLISALCVGQRTYHLKDYEALESGKEQFPASNDVCTVIGCLVRLNGVVSVTVKTYEFAIEIARAFDWEDVQKNVPGIQKNVLGIIKEHLFDDVKVWVYDTTEPKF
jgi:hypothetical protein